MRIRCERCSTVYELDERRLPPQGAAVKCTRCQLVFRAYPPASPGDAAASSPAAVGVDAASGEGAPASGADGGGRADAVQDDRTAVFGYAPGGSPERTASFATAEPPEPGPVRAGAARPPRVRSASVAAPSRPGRQVLLGLLVAAFAAAALLAWLALRAPPR